MTDHVSPSLCEVSQPQHYSRAVNVCVWGCQLVDSQALVETVTDHVSLLGRVRVAQWTQ